MRRLIENDVQLVRRLVLMVVQMGSESDRSITVGMKQNLPGGDSAVVPPDPMPNSEVKRRSADGSVGLPHVRVGNCQASNKWKAPVGRQGLFAVCVAESTYLRVSRGERPPINRLSTAILKPLVNKISNLLWLIDIKYRKYSVYLSIRCDCDNIFIDQVT